MCSILAKRKVHSNSRGNKCPNSELEIWYECYFRFLETSSGASRPALPCGVEAAQCNADNPRNSLAFCRCVSVWCEVDCGAQLLFSMNSRAVVDFPLFFCFCYHINSDPTIPKSVILGFLQALGIAKLIIYNFSTPYLSRCTSQNDNVVGRARLLYGRLCVAPLESSAIILYLEK